MTNQEVAKRVTEVVKKRFATDVTGHDFWHMDRVRKNALNIAATEPAADQFVVELAALLHDIEDHKFGGNDEKLVRSVTDILQPLGVDQSTIDLICEAIRTVSFSGSTDVETPTTIEGKIVQDADRLDAIGAIGIARAFATGSAVFGQSIYNPDTIGEKHSSTIQHFHDKLLLLKDRMQTKEGRRLAEPRHIYLANFLEQFLAEWEGESQ